MWPKPGTKSRKAKFRLSMLLSDDPETSDFDQKLEIRLPNVRRPQRRVSNVVILEALDQSGLQQFWNAVSPRNPQNPEAPLSDAIAATSYLLRDRIHITDPEFPICIAAYFIRTPWPDVSPGKINSMPSRS